ncbi:MAG: 2-octaprenyl-6-methoxyphenyl hydroxylase [Gammaproteobacteria bacterium]|nr:2-octaprenyl-6-methoxyphenyl hydroxylase [Gammaproteobacteria bacterium]
MTSDVGFRDVGAIAGVTTAAGSEPGLSAQPDYDILIVGGGMVGASLGIALGGGGLRVGVIESVPYGEAGQPSYDDRTVALAYGSKRIFSTLGVWDSLQSAAGVTAISRIHVSDRGHFGFTHLDADAAGVEALGYVVENRVLGAVLSARLRATAGVELLQPATLMSVDFAGDIATVGLDHAGLVRRLAARLVVAADGGDSAVRSLAGIAVRRADYGQTAVVANVSVELPHRGTAFERFTEHGPLALLPMSENRCSVVWSLPTDQADAVLALPDAVFLERLYDSFGSRLGRFTKAGKRRTYALALTRVAEHVRPRLALIGNAAHTLHPVAGQGFNLGLRDVAALSQVLAEAWHRGDDPGDVSVLRVYADWRRRDNLAVSTFTDGVVRLFSNNFAPLVAARNFGLVAVDLFPGIKRALLQRTMGLAGRLPRLARGLPLF